ncbi:MAG TPA: cell division protein FtsK [Candidatus Faecenecus gallistercoris]|uniref:Cell division protein FtsK n=1 Tax=Candidatus Faecenecus gallistercoris TaxID=2840793 RepID=A0A9D1CJV5_9FIRM|nr:cell division protein FtsK [Candidatus Faecenecus gallistercoris]
MAKRKHRKEKEEKRLISNPAPLVGVILIIVSLLGILPTPLGIVGEVVASFAMFLVGTGYQILLLAILILGFYLCIKKESPNFFNTHLIGVYLITIGLIVLAHLNYVTENNGDIAVVVKETVTVLMNNFAHLSNGTPLTLTGAGIIGCLLAVLFSKLFAVLGTYIVAGVIIALGIFFATGLTFSTVWEKITSKVDLHKPKLKPEKVEKEENPEDKIIVEDEEAKKELAKKAEANKSYTISSYAELASAAAKVPPKEPEVEEVTHPVEMPTEHQTESAPRPNRAYRLPSTDILTKNNAKKVNNSEQIEKNILALEKVLRDFGIIGKVVAVTEGPAVTQYELELNSGTKVNKLLNINREISLAMAKKDVRIEAPIPGKSTVGIELPNEKITTVGFREVIESVPKSKDNSKLLAILGKNIMGQAVWFEIDKTPHLLVAGATGSGKSVCINGIIASLLMRTKPDEVKLVLIDPKKVEFSMYMDIPHLLMPVVNDPKKASAALQKLVAEMDHRFSIFSEKGVKNITTYNEWIDKQNAMNPDAKLDHMYYIVAIIDELADLMMVASKEVEDSIMRITQMARAAGIHLIVATQRPSTDVITGVVKANIPSRISFAVSSSIDSRTILDATGAEKLLGKGDMLFLPMGENSPQRIQGAYIPDEDIEKLADYTKSQASASYNESFLNLTESDKPSVDDVKNSPEEYEDPLYNEIVDFAILSGKISASQIQRKYRLGYNRAARIIDLLEELGIVGPANGSKPREVLVKPEGTPSEE